MRFTRDYDAAELEKYFFCTRLDSFLQIQVIFGFIRYLKYTTEILFLFSRTKFLLKTHLIKFIFVKNQLSKHY